MNYANAFHRRQGGMFIPCDGCTMSQKCGIHGRCYRDICGLYNQQQFGLGGMLSGAPSWEQPTSLFRDFRRDYNMLREADSDGGECD